MLLDPGGRYVGNLGRNVLIGPGMLNPDLALDRNFTITEQEASIPCRSVQYCQPSGSQFAKYILRDAVVWVADESDGSQGITACFEVRFLDRVCSGQTRSLTFPGSASRVSVAGRWRRVTQSRNPPGSAPIQVAGRFASALDTPYANSVLPLFDKVAAAKLRAIA